MMPGMDGWVVLQRLKADPDLAEIPVMMVTISSEREMASTLGAVEHLTKPVDRDTLRRLAAKYAEPGGGGHALVVDERYLDEIAVFSVDELTVFDGNRDDASPLEL